MDDVGCGWVGFDQLWREEPKGPTNEERCPAAVKLMNPAAECCGSCGKLSYYGISWVHFWIVRYSSGPWSLKTIRQPWTCCFSLRFHIKAMGAVKIEQRKSLRWDWLRTHVLIEKRTLFDALFSLPAPTDGALSCLDCNKLKAYPVFHGILPCIILPAFLDIYYFLILSDIMYCIVLPGLLSWHVRRCGLLGVSVVDVGRLCPGVAEVLQWPSLPKKLAMSFWRTGMTFSSFSKVDHSLTFDICQNLQTMSIHFLLNRKLLCDICNKRPSKLVWLMWVLQAGDAAAAVSKPPGQSSLVVAFMPWTKEETTLACHDILPLHHIPVLFYTLLHNIPWDCIF